MRHCIPIIAVSALLLPGCQAQEPVATPEAVTASPAVSESADIALVAATSVYNANGDFVNQEIETAEATPENVKELFHSLDWQHARNTCGISITRSPGGSSPDRAKLGVSMLFDETSGERELSATLSETSPGEAEERQYLIEPLESTDVGLQLLLSFLSADGMYRSMVEWQEK